MISARTLALTYARSLWRRRWYGIAVAWLFCLAGWTFVTFLPDMYQAKARIYVDTDSMLRPLMRGIAVDTNILSQVDLMQRTLLSRPNLQKVSHMADLDLAAHTTLEQEEVVSTIREHISVEAEGPNLFSLSYTGPSRDTATKVVQSLLTVFVESNLGNSRKDMLSARNFIDDQLRDYAQQLDEAEKRIAEFKAQNMGLLPGENSFAAKLDTAKQSLDQTNAQLDESRQKRDELTRQLTTVPKYIETLSTGPDQSFGSGPPVAGGSDSSTGNSEEDAHVDELEHELKAMLENYTDQYPDVIKIKKLLENAKADAKKAKEDADKKAAENAAANKPADTPAADPRATKNTSPNPVYEQLQLQLVSLNTDIASLESRAKRQQADIKQWEGSAKNVPEVGAQMTKLTRDYDVIKKAYDELLNRRESAKIGSDLETQTQTVQFRIIDPPQAPPYPVAPKRGLLLSVVLLGGIGAGVAFAFLLSQIDDSITTLRELKELVAVPVLGAISMVRRASDLRRRAIATAGFVGVCLALLAAFAGVFTIEGLGRMLS